jgi:hypothetical protein
MKVCISLFLILFIFFEFTSLATDVEDTNTVNISVECLDIDSHSDDVADHDSEDSHHESHGNCHMGHSHTAIIDNNFIIGSIITKLKKTRINLQYHLSIQDYHSRLNRPPIA